MSVDHSQGTLVCIPPGLSGKKLNRLHAGFCVPARFSASKHPLKQLIN